MRPLVLDNPYLESLGVCLTHWSPSRTEMRLDIAPHMANRSGRIQGGILCALLDAAAGYAGLHAGEDQAPRHSVTLSLTTQFLDSGKAGSLIARGYLERQGHSIYFARSEVWLGERLLASAVGTFKYMNAPK